jgi:dihydropteroate synthase
MIKYYTRACNFYYGSTSRYLVKKKLALPLCGNKNISFDKLEIFTRDKKKIFSKIINISNIDNQNINLKKKIKKDIKKITLNRKFFNKIHIMGILNMTPDSFSDGGKYNRPKKAFKKIHSMIKSGAEIIDIGGESTRPKSKTVPTHQEWKRIENVVKNFKKKYPNIMMSIDTRKSEIMSKSIHYNADIINDVSSFDFDPKTILKIEKFNVWKVLHHMQGTPQTMQISPKYQNVLLDVYDFFEDKIYNQLKNTKYSKKIILDPGIGFGKNLKHNLILINNISLFHSLGFPILIGTSRKSFINQISNKFDTIKRIGGSVASVIFSLSQGVQIFRVHDVNEIKQGILVYKKLLDQ